MGKVAFNPCSLPPSHRAANDVKGAIPSVHQVTAHLARRFQQICLGLMAEVLEPTGLTPLQYAVIASLDDAPGIDQRRLADRLAIDTVSAHHLINELEAAGLVRRRIGTE